MKRGMQDRCPKCGRELKWDRHPVRTWRELGYCMCSAAPVVERDATHGKNDRNAESGSDE